MLAKEGSYHVDCSDLFICRFLFGTPAFPSHTQLCYCILSIFNKAYWFVNDKKKKKPLTSLQLMKRGMVSSDLKQSKQKDSRKKLLE